MVHDDCVVRCRAGSHNDGSAAQRETARQLGADTGVSCVGQPGAGSILVTWWSARGGGGEQALPGAGGRRRVSVARGPSEAEER